MPPYDDMPIDDDYSDVALMLASVREWPAEDFARELDERVQRRFGPEDGTPSGRRTGRGRLPRWTLGPAVAVVAAAAGAVVVLSGGGLGGSSGSTGSTGSSGQKLPTTAGYLNGSGSGATKRYQALGSKVSLPARHVADGVETPTVPNSTNYGVEAGSSNAASSSAGVPTAGTGAVSSSTGSGAVTGATNLSTVGAPLALGGKQIQSAQISLTTPNRYVDTVAHEVFGVVSFEHGTVQNSQITTATNGSGGGYAWFTLSVPTSNLQDTMTRLSDLRFASVSSRVDQSQNVSNQYSVDQRHLADAKALRISLLKQLATAYTQTAIDSIKAQLRIAERQITTWQNALNVLQHRISYSNLTVGINQNGLPFAPVHKSSFGIGRAAHDALRVLVVAAGVALIALAAAVPVGLVAALLVWLWVWLRQRRREHALDVAA